MSSDDDIVVALVLGTMQTYEGEDPEVVAESIVEVLRDQGRLISQDVIDDIEVRFLGAKPRDWALLLKSLEVSDPYEVIDPEDRAGFPLTDAMVTQNVAMLDAMTLDWEAPKGRPTKASGPRPKGHHKTDWTGRGLEKPA